MEIQTNTTILSICIPTYNRREPLLSLLDSLLSIQGPFEVCVHVDGSIDGTVEALSAISDPRLRWQQSPNRGRAKALLAACYAARGKFLMIYDDDDSIFADGLRQILADCHTPIADRTIGFIYHMADASHMRIGSAFPATQSNFLQLRADHQVIGDKKEVVLSEAFRRISYDFDWPYRRVPTSLLWARLSLDFDVTCRDFIIGQKIYFPDGLTANIARIKRRDSYPMLMLHKACVTAYRAGRYRSFAFFCRSLLGVMYYGLYARAIRLL